MSDRIIDELVQANPVPRDSLGGLDHDHARQLLDRITAPERPRDRVTRRVAIAVLVAIGITAPLAFAAQRTTLLDFAFRDSVPSSVKQVFRHGFPPPHGSKEGPPGTRDRRLLIESSERLVTQITTGSGKVARLYVVDLRNGGNCWLAVGRPFNGGGCGTPPAASQHRPPIMATMGTGGRHASGTFATGAVYMGRVTSDAVAQMVVHFADGDTDEIPIDGGWFMYEVPEAHERIGHEPTRIGLLDRAGATVATVKDPFLVHPPAQAPAEKPLGSRVLLRLPLHFRDGSLELQVAKGSLGNRCVRVFNTIDTIQTRNWTCGTFVGRTSDTRIRPPRPVQPVEWGVGRRTKDGKPAGYVYFKGWAGSAVARVELRFQDSTVEQFTLHERQFLYIVPRDRWVLGKRPSYLIGRDASGRVVYRRFLYPAARCSYPDRDARCRGIIYSGG